MLLNTFYKNMLILQNSTVGAGDVPEKFEDLSLYPRCVNIEQAQQPGIPSSTGQILVEQVA